MQHDPLYIITHQARYHTWRAQVLRCLQPVAADDTVLGQYTAAGSQAGYLDDPTVPKGSKTPTFATCVLRIHNERCASPPGRRF